MHLKTLLGEVIMAKGNGVGQREQHGKRNLIERANRPKRMKTLIWSHKRIMSTHMSMTEFLQSELLSQLECIIQTSVNHCLIAAIQIGAGVADKNAAHCTFVNVDKIHSFIFIIFYLVILPCPAQNSTIFGRKQKRSGDIDYKVFFNDFVICNTNTLS